jgi:hypothetical protein
MKYIIIVFGVLTCIISQAQDRWYIKGNSYCDIIVNDNGDTTFLDPIPLYFPVINYLDYSSEIDNAYMLSCYSKTLTSLNEPIKYKDKDKFIRVVLLEESTSTSYRIEIKPNGKYLLTISKIEGNYEDSKNLRIDSTYIKHSIYQDIANCFSQTKIWDIKPHSVDFYAFDEKHLMLFESNIKGGYHFTDIHFSLTLKEPLFKDFYKAVEKIKNL